MFVNTTILTGTNKYMRTIEFFKFNLFKLNTVSPSGGCRNECQLNKEKLKKKKKKSKNIVTT